ncbi:TetR family transcriptional regulator [Pseudomonas aeruginosa]|nr:TetR family transcriptional regulator [Pseudomonas sp. ANT_H4]KAA0950709.1 TetR family transcriptional regulator [Pseudomonas sp. ANT_H14]MBA1307291.1 TetR family transcriptional regulator [Stutzerimonas stutzeri]MBA4290889.1 TetR family transcriptional regulator [Pseudomonas sp.]NPX55503.1 TetR family transcriptional regulator [Pseudomonas aeruginosa]
MVEGNQKLSISSVARAAGVTPGLIHNTYPAVAERIRNLMGKSVRAQRDSKHQALMKEKELNKALRAENSLLLEELARLASVNQRLMIELAQLDGVAQGKVVTLAPKPGAK